MIPRITISFIVIVLVAYVIGARWPMLAQKLSLA